MKKFKISYYYLATGMEGRADTMPERVITAEDRDHAIFEYNHGNWKSFEEFMREKQYIREWGLTVKEL